MKKRIRQTVLVAAAFVCGALAPNAQAFDKPYVGSDKTYTAKYIDTFVHLARDYNLGFVEIRAANPGIDPWIPGEGTRITLPTRHILPKGEREGIVINISEMRLYYFKDGAEEPVTYPIGVGREGLDTPLGTTTVQRKTENPHWYPTERMRKEDPELPEVVRPGPENPLGTRILYLGWPTYAIHGTNRPFGIGRRISSGCIRLYPEDITDLFENVPVGTKVTVVDEPIKAAWINGRFFVEAHADREQALQIESGAKVSEPKLRKKDIKAVIEAAGDKAESLNWQKIRKIMRERRGFPVAVSGPDLSADDFDQNARMIRTGTSKPSAGESGLSIKDRVDAIYKKLQAQETGAKPAEAQKEAATKSKQDRDAQEPQDVVSYEDPEASFKTLNQ